MHGFFESLFPCCPAQTVYEWRTMPLAWPSEDARREAVRTGQYDAAVSFPVGIEVMADRIFFAFSNFRPGIAATVTTIPRPRSSATQVRRPP